MIAYIYQKANQSPISYGGRQINTKLRFTIGLMVGAWCFDCL